MIDQFLARAERQTRRQIFRAHVSRALEWAALFLAGLAALLAAQSAFGLIPAVPRGPALLVPLAILGAMALGWAFFHAAWAAGRIELTPLGLAHGLDQRLHLDAELLTAVSEPAAPARSGAARQWFLAHVAARAERRTAGVARLPRLAPRGKSWRSGWFAVAALIVAVLMIWNAVAPVAALTTYGRDPQKLPRRRPIPAAPEDALNPAVTAGNRAQSGEEGLADGGAGAGQPDPARRNKPKPDDGRGGGGGENGQGRGAQDNSNGGGGQDSQPQPSPSQPPPGQPSPQPQPKPDNQARGGQGNEPRPPSNRPGMDAELDPAKVKLQAEDSGPREKSWLDVYNFNPADEANGQPIPLSELLPRMSAAGRVGRMRDTASGDDAKLVQDYLSRLRELAGRR